jgi:hypothetical protein
METQALSQDGIRESRMSLTPARKCLNSRMAAVADKESIKKDVLAGVG